MVLKSDALAELPDRAMRKSLVELGWPNRITWTSCAFRFRGWSAAAASQEIQRHRLGLVEAHHHAPFLAGKIQKRELRP